MTKRVHCVLLTALGTVALALAGGCKPPAPAGGGGGGGGTGATTPDGGDQGGNQVTPPDNGASAGPTTNPGGNAATSGTQSGNGFQITPLPGEKVTGGPATTASGLSYYEITPGTGASPTDPQPAVLINYTGYFESGQVFDSSNGTPVCWILVPASPGQSGLIPGFVEGIKSMKAGGKRKLVIPSNLAYGPQGQGPIPPNTTLVFDVELLGIDPYTTVGDPMPGEVVSGDPRLSSAGIRYWALAEGEGAPVVPDSAVKANFAVYRADGQPLRAPGGEPAHLTQEFIFPALWQEIVGMKPGGKRKIILPWEQAGGLQGQPPAVPPKCTMVADIEILAVDPYVTAEAPFPGDSIEGDPMVTVEEARYWVITEGTGERTLGPDDVGQVAMGFWLPDGTLLNQSTAEQPDHLVKGVEGQGLPPAIWSGIEGMKLGEKRKLIIPWEKGFGASGNPMVGIPPKATLVFDLELVGINAFSELGETIPGDPVVGDPIVTESGVTMYELRVGDGPAPPDANATVRVHMVYWLVDGTQVESTYTQGSPMNFPLAAMAEQISGLAEGIATMKVGGKRKIIVPADLAFGMAGQPAQVPIPPGAMLIFDVDLVEVTPGAPAPGTPPATPPGGGDPVGNDAGSGNAGDGNSTGGDAGGGGSDG